MATLHNLDWLFAIGVIFFLLSCWGIGANDVANSYATSVSSKSLTLIQAGILAVFTEFIGAIALGQQVTSTIRSGVFSVTPFKNSPGVLILAMVVAEVGSATWLVICTRLGFPVSTTQSIVGALVGVGIALDLQVNWGWKSGSVSQIAASWAVAPLIAAGFGGIIMMSIKILVHWQKDPLKAALRVITFYYAFTAGVLALFIVISGGHGIPTLEQMGPGEAIGITLGVFFGVWLIALVFFLPYYYRKLIKEDHRLRPWHIPMGPMLWRENYTLYFPGSAEAAIVPDYYETEYKGDHHPSSSTEDVVNEKHHTEYTEGPKSATAAPATTTAAGAAADVESAPPTHETAAGEPGVDYRGRPSMSEAEAGQRGDALEADTAHRKDLKNIEELPWAHPKRIWSTTKLTLTYGITRDVIHHQSRGLEDVHAKAPVFDNKVEHLWTTAQVCSAMIMSIAHGANDISNAIGPFTTEYETWISGVSSATTDTPDWIKAVGGLTLGVGFWTFGYHIMRNLGNRITKHSPTRGYSMELGAAITVLMASRLGLPISTTQCITGAIIGVALTNGDLGSINWKQLGKIFIGWVLTVPCAGLVSGILMGIAINTPHWATV